MNSLSRSDTDSPFYSPGSVSIPQFKEYPLFTQEEIDEIRKKRASLEMEVQTLEQQLKSRREQIQQSKENMVTLGEINLLKAETRDSISESNSSHLSQIMTEFTDIIKQSCELTAKNSTLDQEIKEEEIYRLNIGDEYDIIEHAFDLSDLKAKIPEIKSLKREIPKIEQEDYERYNQNLKSSQKELSSFINDTGPSTKQVEAANAVLKAFDSDINYRKMGATIEKAENTRLELLLAQSESKNKSIEDEIELSKRKISSIQLETSNICIACEAQIKANDIAFNNSMKTLESEIQLVQQKIDNAADKYDDLCEQIAKMQVVEVDEQDSLSVIMDSDSSGEEIDFDFNDNVSRWDIEEQNLVVTRKKLIQEINEIKKKYNETRKIAIERETEKQNYIKDIYSKYQKNKLEIGNYISELYSSSLSQSSPQITSTTSSGLTSDLNIVLEHISSSISNVN
ncbi:hypothetical protein TVAG_067770 [Trichomonas vaginalis G3]|uniref:Uncharacterized protein n=1 Tax=Trichomonas vaginalis (strain ATCC PRA-98 / G3) TaxID=412133 RepID=A2EMG1_TRIV3|nr:hypothetical protein TVAGG3_0499100 [Trichomonas vaginalis G3]EAY06117.1 hypothetical protein TVAG_067770 [Trichomonas vaginalis G3]KAI5516940.1 hypothetical protein TVAGG3_0499100 [Trichomonas vaginalis G3]|eukprot:XP_001318340.1 hypothetical protein [Trichomonas vaginalis G3]